MVIYTIQSNHLQVLLFFILITRIMVMMCRTYKQLFSQVTLLL